MKASLSQSLKIRSNPLCVHVALTRQELIKIATYVPRDPFHIPIGPDTYPGRKSVRQSAIRGVCDGAAFRLIAMLRNTESSTPGWRFYAGGTRNHPHVRTRGRTGEPRAVSDEESRPIARSAALSHIARRPGREPVSHIAAQCPAPPGLHRSATGLSQCLRIAVYRFKSGITQIVTEPLPPRTKPSRPRAILRLA